MTTEQANPIDQIAARLDGGRKWCKGDLGDVRGNGPVCLVGALDATGLLSHPVAMIIRDVIVERFPDRLVSWHPARSQFNNHPDTVFSDIEDVVLPKARQLYEDRLAGL